MKTVYLTQKRKSEAKEASTCLFVFFSLTTLIFAIHSQIDHPALNFSILLGAGYLGWTFIEYFMHRFYMHSNLKDVNSKTYQTHMNHHKHPTDIKITAYQRALFFLGGIILVAIAIYLNNYFTCFVGFYIGFVFYTVLHVILHHRWGRYILPRVQIAHIHHHGKYPETGFSFSTILWDYMFGTMAPKDAVITEQMINFYFKDDHHHN